MRPFPSSLRNQYILLGIDYGEVRTLPTDDTKSMVKKNIFARFGMPPTLVSDEGPHFCSRKFEIALVKYSVRHQITKTYHPQANRKIEVSNREIKQILEKVVNPNRKVWALRLDDALWAYRIAYKTL
ncbi:protein NYNRIN-like [Gossypium australe]|uniref:Protein NYNRIN-like n=1 Tax=Gossypium australe TaxID=47621 RepID=A0A5B6V901_9ROSI|nr:protein NYNRIN-like [Gossypium australe]